MLSLLWSKLLASKTGIPNAFLIMSWPKKSPDLHVCWFPEAEQCIWLVLTHRINTSILVDFLVLINSFVSYFLLYFLTLFFFLTITIIPVHLLFFKTITMISSTALNFHLYIVIQWEKERERRIVDYIKYIPC